MHIDSIEGLLNFLSIQESTVADPAAMKYEDQLIADKETYNIKDVAKEKEATDEGEEVEADKEDEEVEVVTKDSKIIPSLDSLIRNINDLRSGESLKRAEIRDEVGEYFDSLSIEEQSVLVLFLRELAAVVTKSKTGAEAQDPSEEPEKLVIKKTDSERTEEPEAATTKPAANQSVEDDSAPIKVNESQDVTEIRRRFKILTGHR